MKTEAVKVSKDEFVKFIKDYPMNKIIDNYMQIAELTDEEKFEIYMKIKKRKLIRMLIECHKIIDVISAKREIYIDEIG